MRWLRLLIGLLFSKFRSKLTLDETSELSFTVWLTDLDVSIMNHAAMMTVFEVGRIDLMVRTGFFKIARKKNWYFPSSAISVQFLRPLKLFQKAILTTRVFHVNDNFIFTEQKITRQGKDIAICIVKSKVKFGRENISTGEIMNLINATQKPAEAKELIELFEREHAGFKDRLCS